MLTELKVKNFRQQVQQRISSPDWTWEEACEMGLMARNVRDVSNWIIGQVAAGIQVRWGEDRLGEFAKLLGFQRKTIEQYRWVVTRFKENYDPQYGLPWSFYRLAAGTDKPEQTIQKFVDDHLSYKEADNVVKGLPIARECNHDVEKLILYKCKKCFAVMREKK